MTSSSDKTLVLVFSCVQSAPNSFKIFSIYAKTVCCVCSAPRKE